MPIQFVCTSCNTKMKVPDEHAGKRVKCPKCEAILQLPAASSTSPSAAPAPSQAPAPPSFDASPDVPPEPDPFGGSFDDPLANPYDSQPANQYGMQGGYQNAPVSNYGGAATGYAGGGHLQPHRGGTILALGLVALFCNVMFIPGILAWIWGKSDLRQMDAGTMDREGYGLTQAGMILGMVLTILPLVFILLYIIFIVIMIVIGVAGAAAGA